jgi:hypothetical protein
MKIAWLPICIALCLGIRLADGAVLFPVPEGLTPSPHYQIEVETKDGSWQPAFVYLSAGRTSGTGAADQPGRSMSWTTFFADGPVRVRATSKRHAAKDVVVRPSRHGILPKKIAERQVEFTLQPGQKVSVEFPGSINPSGFTGPPFGIPVIMDSLVIFADVEPIDDPLSGYASEDIARILPGNHAESLPVTDLPGGKEDRSKLGDVSRKRVVHFLPGVHDLGYWQVQNSVDHIHFSPGAFVYGAIDVIPQGRVAGEMDIDKIYRDAWFSETQRDSFTVTGHGILCGSKLPWHLKKDFSYHQNDHYWQHIKLVQFAVRDITFRDLTLCDASYWTISFINDADSRPTGVFDNFKIVGSWTYNNDGLPLAEGGVVRNCFIHANDDSFKLYHSGGRIENCVLWQNCNGAVFQFGWFAKSLSGLTVSDIDIIHFENWYGVNQGNRAVFNYADAGGPGLIEKVSFENIAIEGRVMRLFGFKAVGGQKLRDFHFNGLSCGGMGAGQIGPPGRNYFFGDITDFEFTNFVLGDLPVTDFKSGQFDFGGGAGERFTFKSTQSTKP